MEYLEELHLSEIEKLQEHVVHMIRIKTSELSVLTDPQRNATNEMILRTSMLLGELETQRKVLARYAEVLKGEMEDALHEQAKE